MSYIVSINLQLCSQDIPEHITSIGNEAFLACRGEGCKLFRVNLLSILLSSVFYIVRTVTVPNFCASTRLCWTVALFRKKKEQPFGQALKVFVLCYPGWQFRLHWPPPVSEAALQGTDGHAGRKVGICFVLFMYTKSIQLRTEDLIWLATHLLFFSLCWAAILSEILCMYSSFWP